MEYRSTRIGDLEYFISENGDVLKRKGKGHLKQFRDKDGYYKISTTNGNGITHNVFTHRLVYTVFVGNIPDDMTVDHVDGDKENNHYSNFQLLTPEENAVKGNAQLWKFVSPLGEVVEIYNLKQFCRDNGLHPAHMSYVSKGKPHYYQHKGWKRYIE